MTPLECELLSKIIMDWEMTVIKIQDKYGDGDNNIIQNLKIEVIDLVNTLTKVGRKQ